MIATGSNMVFFIDPVGTLQGVLFMSGTLYGLFAHLSLIGELKKLGVVIHPFVYGQIFFIEFEYLKQPEYRTKKLDRLAVSSMVAFVGGPALAALIGLVST